MEWIKHISYIIAGAVGWIFSYTDCNEEAVTILAVLMILDSITGWLKVVRIGDKPETNKLTMGIFAKVMLIILPMILIITGKGVGIDFKFMAGSILSILILSETYSIVGNTYTIKTGIASKEFDAVSAVLKGIMAILRKAIDKMSKL